MTWRLKALIDTPVQINEVVLVLGYLSGHQGGTFEVRTLR